MQFQLTQNNYYSAEANNAYWSASFVKQMLDCPARAMAELSGEYCPEPSVALLVGSYVDTYFEGTLEEFKEQHPELYKKNGELKSDFIKAEAMIKRASSDPTFMAYMEGEKQRIFTGTIGGVPFKAKFDVYRPGVLIADLKTCKDMEPVYKPGEGKLSFAEAWNWPLQLAIYQELERQNSKDGIKLPTFLNVVTKQDPPDIAVIEVPQHVLDTEMEVLLEKLPYLDAIRSGIIEADRCEKCAYCRASKKLDGAISLDNFIEFEGD